MKHKNNEGSSLLEIVIAMAILAVIVIPVCSSLILSHRMNAKTEAVLQAQLDVAAAVEYYMATGIPEDAEITETGKDYSKDYSKETADGVVPDEFPAVQVRIVRVIRADDNKVLCYRMTFSSETGKMVDGILVPDVTVETTIRSVVKTETQTDQASGEDGTGED